MERNLLTLTNNIRQGRITQGIGGLYYIDTGDNIYACRPKGLFRIQDIEPVIGDFVDIEISDSLTKDGMTEGVIKEIHPRENQLLRPKVSNVTQSVLVFSATNPPINLDLLDRLIVLSEEQGLNIIIVLNKAEDDLPPHIQDIVQTYENIGYTVIVTSAKSGQGVAELKAHLSNHVSVFSGSSGVGKSSLVNVIHPTASMDVGEISQKGKRGKHTTRFSKLIKLGNDATAGFVVDSPGFSSLFFNFGKEELASYFKEFTPFMNQCRFGDCNHLQEPGCNIKEQIGNNISQARYERYVNLYKELV